jgi:hypothetical protein
MGSSGIGGQQQQVAKTSVFQQMRDSLQSVLLKPRTLPVPRWVSPQHYTVTLSEFCGHASFILVAVSYAMDDFLELRIMAVAGSTAMLFFTYFHPHGRVLWLPFKWNVLFIAINSYRIGNVFAKRLQAEKLPAELMAIRENHFYILDKVDFYKLVHLGRMETFQPGDLVVSQVSDTETWPKWVHPRCLFRKHSLKNHFGPLSLGKHESLYSTSGGWRIKSPS